MKPEQRAIYYLLADDLKSAARSNANVAPVGSAPSSTRGWTQSSSPGKDL